jgi:squalene-hopene/tetraprenyl-beta-curcumene cyclase
MSGKQFCPCLALLACLLLPAPLQADDFQYQFEAISVPRATADEPVRAQLSIEAAAEYLEHGSVAWSGQRKCVSCHTNGTYMTIRPQLSRTLGPPDAANRVFFIEQLQKLQAEPLERLRQSTRPAQVIYIAAGLAEWDAAVGGSLSPETETAIELMFRIQTDEGTWGTLDCWPPFESDAYHEATVAAMAAAAAPGWIAKVRGTPASATAVGLEKLRQYLRTQPPLHDYSRVLLLWAAARMPDLLPQAQRQELQQVLLRHQKSDGSWSIRSFAAPEAWGGGNRAAKLKAEPEFADPPGDGHMTGLAIVVLRENGTAASDAAIQKGLVWLKNNQRESGRWWTRSLNTDSWHFITYSGTAYPLLALQLCDELPVAGVSP